MPCVVSGKDALVLVVEMRPDSTVRGDGWREGQMAEFKGLWIQQSEFGRHPGDSGEYGSFCPSLADQIFLSSWSTESPALRQEATWAQLRQFLQCQQSWRLSFRNPSQGNLLLSYISWHQRPAARGNEMHQRRPASVLKGCCN